MMMRPGPGVYQPMGQMANFGAIAMGNRGGRMQQGGGGAGGAGGGGPAGNGIRGGPAGGGKQGQMQQRSGFQQRPPQGGPPQGAPPSGQQQRKPMPGGMPMPQPGAQPQAARQDLSATTLAAAPPEQQKQLLGERLFPLIQNIEPQLAGKITGMLLEMDNGELLNLLESPDALQAKIMEALSVLQMHADNSMDEVTVVG